MTTTILKHCRQSRSAAEVLLLGRGDVVTLTAQPTRKAQMPYLVGLLAAQRRVLRGIDLDLSGASAVQTTVMEPDRAETSDREALAD